MKISAEMDKLSNNPRWVLHPVTPLLLWVGLAVLTQASQGMLLLLMAAGSVLLALWRADRRFLSLLRRTRWILLSLVLLYAYVTPGEPMFAQWGGFSPVREGVLEGALQLARLLTILASLALLLSLLAREQIIAALHALLFPLQYAGLARERMAVRLALTLHYAEQQLQFGATDRATISRMLDFAPTSGSVVELHTQRLGWRDGLLLAGALLLVVWGLQ
ncbi:MAG TPA: CbiQ family ECF transporter T component [Gallionellaceae bacterium]